MLDDQFGLHAHESNVHSGHALLKVLSLLQHLGLAILRDHVLYKFDILLLSKLLALRLILVHHLLEGLEPAVQPLLRLHGLSLLPFRPLAFPDPKQGRMVDHQHLHFVLYLPLGIQ